MINVYFTILSYIRYSLLLKIKNERIKQAKEALKGNDAILVTEPEEIVFEPKNGQAKKGLIFYPGGLVEPESYATLCEQIAEQGYFVVIVPMRANLAILSPDRADRIIEAYKDITTWAIGGHSLGGVMAANYAASHEAISGVVLYASYPQGEALKESTLPVLSIYGEKDGVANLDKVKNAALPKQASLREIKGGNHCYFGSYGMQKGDNEASITPEEQQEQAAKETAAFLEQL